MAEGLIPFTLRNPDSSGGGSLPFSGRQGEAMHKGSATEFDVSWIPQRGPVTAAHFPGADFHETADHADLDLTGSIEIIVWARLSDWTTGVNGTFVSKMNSAALAAGGGYEALLNTSNQLVFAISDGATRLAMSSAANVLTDGRGYWIRFQYDNAAKTTTFSTSDQSLSTPLADLKFAPFGTSAAHGGGSPTANAVVLRLAQRPTGGTSPLTGDLGRVVVKNASGVIVADWRGDAPMNRHYDSTGKLWTTSGSSWGWRIVES